MKISPKSKKWLGRPALDRRMGILPILLTLSLNTSAESLKFAGILGNSGEQGQTLVRFSEKQLPGTGVAFDPSGSLLDRGGDGTLNRYALDGRQIASYPIEKNGQKTDSITILGEDLILKINKKLYSLPLNSADKTAPTLLPNPATQLSFNNHEGWAAAANGKEIFTINRHGEKRDVTNVDKEPQNIEIGPDGGIFITIDGKLSRVDPAATEKEKGPWEAPGDRSQWLNGFWFGGAGHGTLRRFNAELKQDPGVVLGGASGWFIGYVEGNHEIDNPRGLAHIRGNLYAVSGDEGIVHLLEWHPIDKRFTIIRRIGAVTECTSLAIDSKGRIWHHTGVWDWTDGPDAPIHHSVPSPTGGLKGIVVTANDIMVGPGIRWGREVIYYGDLEGPAKLQDKIEPLPKTTVASALIKWDKNEALFISDTSGKGIVYSLASDGRPGNKIADLELKSATPFNNLTSLATTVSGNLLAATDGEIIEFSGNQATWQETKRWKSWGDSADAKFGATIHIAAQGEQLWVSDTDRHRVLVFKNGAPIATFGTTDQPGNDLTHLTAPKAIATNNNRAVFHDSGNQRLIKLELQP